MLRSYSWFMAKIEITSLITWSRIISITVPIWIHLFPHGLPGKDYRFKTVACLFLNPFKDKYTLQYLRWSPTRVSCRAHTSLQCYMAAWMGGGFGGEWIHVYVWLSSFVVHLKLSQNCYSAIQFSSVARSCPTLCDAMDHITTGLPVIHQFP